MRRLLLGTSAALVGAAFATILSPQIHSATMPSVAPAVSAISAPFTRSDVQGLHQEVLNPTVRVETANAFGSGTIVHSDDDGVFIVTNAHVVLAGADENTPADLTKPVKVSNWVYMPGRVHRATPIMVEAKVVTVDKDNDLALLKVTDSDYRADAVATFLSEQDDVDQAEKAFAAGGGIGTRPFVTEGRISLRSLDGRGEEMEGKIVTSAPIVGGNSGGGLYVERDSHYRFAGVPSAVMLAGHMMPLPIPHMAIAIPLKTVRKFLSDNHVTITTAGSN